jgi:hypothetical protein
MKRIVYLVHIRDILYKFGYSDDIQERLRDHKLVYGKDSRLIYCIESKNNTLLESQIKKYVKAYQKKVTINGVVRTELIEINDIDIIKLKKQLFKLNNKINEDKELLLCKERILQLENEKLKLHNLDAHIRLITLENEKRGLDNLTIENEQQKSTITSLTLENEKQKSDIILLNKKLQIIFNIEESNLNAEGEVDKKKLDKRVKAVIYREENSEKIKAADILYREKNAEKIKAKSVLYTEQNAEKIKANRELEENRIKKRAADKLYRENNKERIKLMRQEYKKTSHGKETMRNYYNNNKEELNRKRKERKKNKSNEDDNKDTEVIVENKANENILEN